MKTRLITPEQVERCKSFVLSAGERALQKFNFNKDRVDRLIANNEEFEALIVKAIYDVAVSAQYTDEEVLSKCGYPREYQYWPVNEQVKVLRQFFPELGSFDEQVMEEELSDDIDWFAIPRWQKIASSYHEAVKVVLKHVYDIRIGKFNDSYIEDRLSSEHLRQSDRKIQAIDLIGEHQNSHDILLIPAQFGIRHRGRSVRRVREILDSNEFGLGIYEVGIMLITHLGRLHHYSKDQGKGLIMDCAGDEYSAEADGKFDRVPLFCWDASATGLRIPFIDSVSKLCGSVTAFVPRSWL